MSPLQPAHTTTAVAAPLPEGGAGESPATLRRLAVEAIGQSRWEDAWDLLRQVPAPAPADRLQLNLARNMACLRQHRPEVAAQVVARGGPACRLAVTPGGLMTVVQDSDAGRPMLLSVGGDPAASLRQQLQRIAPVLADGQALALCGLGDGYMLAWLSQNETLGRFRAFGQQRLVVLIEPDPQVLLHLLFIHDLSKPDGPIQGRRFVWCVGPEWAETLARQVWDDAMIPLPAAMLGQGLRGPALIEQYGAVTDRLGRDEAGLAREIEAYYAGLPRSHWIDVLSARPPRPPRILLMTSLYSSVLRHATRDAADAFGRLGWNARLLIEPDPSRRVWSLTLRRQLHEFRPDVVFAIDHLRRETDGIFPAALPYVCWIQDDFDFLTHPSAGRSVAWRDFVLCAALSTYSDTFGYPRRQCLEMGKLTRVPETPAMPEGKAEDLVFVSNASRPPRQIAQDLVSEAERRSPAEADLVRACCDHVLAVYQGGGSIATHWQLRQALLPIARQRGWTWPNEAEIERFVVRLFHPFNDALYRQQALGWVAAVVEARGLTLGLYGKGWEQHPDLARFARGPVAYGVDLERLTRRAAINLQIVPYSCLHQRLLDGLAAGGFFLIRRHPVDILAAEVAAFCRTHVTAEMPDLREARRRLPAAARAALDDLLRRHDDLMRAGALDMVQRYHERVAEGCDHLFDLPPRYAEVSFGDAGEVAERVARFLADEPLRREVAEAQARFVRQHYTYEAGMARVVSGMARLIGGEPAGVNLAAPVSCGVRRCA